MLKKIFTLFLLLLNTSFYLYSFDINNKIADTPSIDGLRKTAKRIEYKLNKYEKNDEEYLSAISDYHAVFDLPLCSLAKVISDHENGDKVFKRLVETSDLNPNDDLSVPHRQRVYNSAKFMGVGADYIYTTIVDVEKYTEDVFIMSWKLVSCEIGNFESYNGFWYLKKLDPDKDGHCRTYVRLYAETVFNNVIPMQDVVMNMFTDSETRDVFRSLYKYTNENE
ncbi:MAG: hypothetical protein PQJ46_11210 [Spirochaetales bacterium]|nr:hypothetical protein [Spirochaetales bacterium]